MTIQTPREAAEALLKSAYDVPHEVDNRPWLDKVEAAFAARDRALFAEDEAVIAVIANVIRAKSTWNAQSIDLARAALAALRRYHGVE